jgi:hypothetical protein
MKLYAYQTSDDSRKFTSYILEDGKTKIGLDFGCRDISVSDAKTLDYIFISHEHRDHWMGLENPKVANALLDRYEMGKLKLYATATTKDLLSVYSSHESKNAVVVNSLIEKITPIRFFEETKIGDISFILFPSGHTYGSSMIYLSLQCDKHFLYTGDMDDEGILSANSFSYKGGLDLDYLLVDGTHLNKTEAELTDKKSLLSAVQEAESLEKPTLWARSDKIIFLAHLLMHIPEVRSKHYLRISPALGNYLQVVTAHGYIPFIPGQIILDSEKYPDQLPSDKTPLYLTPSLYNENVPINHFCGLHIDGEAFKEFLADYYPKNPPHVLIGHYDLSDYEDVLTYAKSVLSSYKTTVISVTHKGAAYEL